MDLMLQYSLILIVKIGCQVAQSMILVLVVLKRHVIIQVLLLNLKMHIHHLVKLQMYNVYLGIIYVQIIVLLDVKIDNVQILVHGLHVHLILIHVNQSPNLIIVIIRHVEVQHLILL